MNNTTSEAEKHPLGILSRKGAETLSREGALREAAKIPGAWLVPKGTYMLDTPILVCSDVSLQFEEGTVLCASRKFSGEALFFAENFRRIRLCGGRFDGAGRTKKLLSFRNGNGLWLESLLLARYGETGLWLEGISRFAVSRVTLLPDSASHDGIALLNGSESGIVRKIRQEGTKSRGAMITLYADSAPVRRIRINDVSSLDCFRFVRIVSTDTEVSDIRIHDVAGGCAAGALVIEEFPRESLFFRPEKKAVIREISASLFELYSTREYGRGKNRALIALKTPVAKFSLKNLSRPGLLDAYPRSDTLLIEGQSRAPVIVAEISLRQISEIVARSKLLIRGLSTIWFETEMRPGERLILPTGGIGSLTAEHKE